MKRLVQCLLTASMFIVGDSSAASIALVDVTTIDPGRGQVLDDQTVLVEDGRITRTGNSTQVVPPDGALIINAPGQFLIPGLADMHVHLEHFDTPEVLDLFLVHGVTLIRQMDGRPLILGWRDAVDSGRLEGPEIISSGPAIDGEPPAEPEYAVAVDRKSGAQAVETQAAAGYDMIKIYHGLSKSAFEGVMTTADQMNLPVAGHVPWRVGIRKAVRLGLRCIEHLDGFDDLVAAEDGDLPEPWHWRRRIFAYPLDSENVVDASQWVATNNVWNVPTLTINDWRWLHPEERQRLESRPAVGWMPETMVKRWRPENWEGDRARLYKQLDESDHEWSRTGFQNALRVVGALHEAGAPLMLGTDTPNPYVVPGDSVHDELANLVAAGLSPMAALATATARPAEYLGRSDIGCLHEGCQADLVLLHDDPLANIAATRTISGVMVNGLFLSETELQARIQDFSSHVTASRRSNP